MEQRGKIGINIDNFLHYNSHGNPCKTNSHASWWDPFTYSILSNLVCRFVPQIEHDHHMNTCIHTQYTESEGETRHILYNSYKNITISTICAYMIDIKYIIQTKVL